MRHALAILFFLTLTSQLPARNKAVLIGIANYPDTSGWQKLSSRNDIQLLKNTFPPDWEIWILEDEKATRNGIVSLLESIAEHTRPGDTVFIHFSGHGQQMIPIEDNGSEPDFLDEALVPFDALQQYTPSYHGENHLRDDEFASLVTKIRSKAGRQGFVMVSLDACHSDSMQKGEDDSAPSNEIIYRGSAEIFGKNVTEKDIKKRYTRDTSRITATDKADVVFLSACQAHSQNQEIKIDDTGYGSLSYAMARALEQHGFSNMDTLLNKVVFAMDQLVPYQYPGIRTSFNYQRPKLNKKSARPAPVQQPATARNRLWPIIATPLLFCLTLTAIALWKKKRHR